MASLINAPRLCLHWLLALGIVLCLVQITAQASAAPADGTGSATERSVKAAFLYKFLGYVEWPPAASGEADAPLTIGVIDADDIAAELAQITAGRTINNRPVAVRRLKEGDPLTGIQVLFIGGADVARLNRLLKMAQQRSILSVTEADAALSQGSVINFMLINGRIRFEVSLDAAEKSNLKLSSRMLAVAYHVQKGAQ